MSLSCLGALRSPVHGLTGPDRLAIAANPHLLDEDGPGGDADLQASLWDVVELRLELRHQAQLDERLHGDRRSEGQFVAAIARAAGGRETDGRDKKDDSAHDDQL